MLVDFVSIADEVPDEDPIVEVSPYPVPGTELVELDP